MFLVLEDQPTVIYFEKQYRLRYMITRRAERERQRETERDKEREGESQEKGDSIFFLMMFDSETRIVLVSSYALRLFGPGFFVIYL